MQSPRPSLHRIYRVSFVLALNAALTAYINSTFLGLYVGPGTIGIIYASAALVTLLGLEFLPTILRTIGDKIATLSLVTIILFALYTLTHGASTFAVVAALICYLSASNLMAMCFDIFIEHFAKEHETGSIRGRYLMVTNLAWMCAPFLAGVIIARFGYEGLYSLAFLCVVLVFVFAISMFKGFKDTKYEHVSFLKVLRRVHTHPNTTHIIVVNFILQFFFAWMVIFMPLYLNTVLGFSWSTIGIIFTIMLSPFVLLDWPLGIVADRWLGEKKLLAAGAIVMGGSTLIAGIYGGVSIVLWAGILFMTRVGASALEVMSETYFFRKISAKEPSVISLFRGMTPLAFLVAPIIGALILHFFSFSILFIFLGIFVFTAIWPIMLLDDSK